MFMPFRGSRQAAAGGGSVSASYRGASANTSGYDPTFSAFDIGSAAADRIVLVGVIVNENDNSAYINGVTVGGNAATALTSEYYAQRAKVRWFGIAVASGTTADIAVDTANYSDCCIIVIATYGGSITPYDTDGAILNSSTASSISATCSVEDGGMIFALSANAGYPQKSYSWSGVTVNADATIGGARVSSAMAQFVSGVTDQAIVGTFGSALESTSAALAVFAMSPA